MTQKEKDLLWSYLVNQELRIESELNELRNRIRFRPIDQVDCTELMLTQQRYQDFTEFALCVIRLLHMEP